MSRYLMSVKANLPPRANNEKPPVRAALRGGPVPVSQELFLRS
jgi:hypothetical protein